MQEKNLDFIIDILKRKPVRGPLNWNETLGFVLANRIGGLFYSRALKQEQNIPPQVKRFLSNHFEMQRRRVKFMRQAISELSKSLRSEGAEHIFLKGSVFAAETEDDSIYEDGERVSNDIDILVKPNGIESVEKALKKAGYIQGKYQAETGELISYPRLEIIKRRMMRGEIVPLLKLTGNPEIPFIEVDVNFSLGNEPSEYSELLFEMIDKRILYDGRVSVYTANAELNFLHLILHQYKESRLYFSIVRGKGLDLYKLADIYFVWHSGAIDLMQVMEYAKKFDIGKELGSVLLQVGSVFADDDMICVGQELGGTEIGVYDYETKKKYAWTADVRKRLLSDNEFAYLEKETSV